MKSKRELAEEMRELACTLNTDEQILAKLEEAITIDPSYARLYFKKGDILDNLGKYEDALEAFDEAIKLEDENGTPNAYTYNDKGNVLYSLKRYKEALKCYDQAIILEPDKGSYYYKKGKVLYELGEYKEAVKCYDQAIECHKEAKLISDNEPDYYGDKGDALYELGEYKEAVKCYDQAIECHNDMILYGGNKAKAKYYDNKGKALSNLGRHEEALEVFDKALIEYDEAINGFDEAIKLNPGNDYAYINKRDAYNDQGNTLEKLGRNEEAIKAFDKALAFDQYEKEIEGLKDIRPELYKNINSDILDEAKHALKLVYGKRAQTQKFTKKEDQDQKEIVKINLDNKICAIEAKKEFNDSFDKVVTDSQSDPNSETLNKKIDLARLEQYIKGYKKQAELIYFDAKAIVTEVKKIDNSNTAIDGVKKIISWISFTSSFSDLIGKVVDSTYGFYNKTKVGTKAKNVLKFKGNETDYNSVIEYITYSALTDENKIKFILDKDGVEKINKQHDEHTKNIIEGLMKVVDKFKAKTIGKAQDWAKDKILEKLKITVGEDSPYYILGKYEATESIKAFIAKGGYHQEQEKLLTQYHRRDTANDRVEKFHFDGHVKVMKPMIEGLQNLEFNYEVEGLDKYKATKSKTWLDEILEWVCCKKDTREKESETVDNKEKDKKELQVEKQDSFNFPTNPVNFNDNEGEILEVKPSGNVNYGGFEFADA